MNIIIIAGRIGKDCENRYMPDGRPVVSFPLADDNYGKTVWWRCSMFGERAGKLAEYLTKGKAVTVSGHINADDNGNPRTWTDKEGNTRASFELTVDNVALQGGKQENREPEEELPL